MGVRFPSASSIVLVNSSIATTVNTVVCTLPVINLSLDSALVAVFWWLEWIPGTASTGSLFRVVRGTLASGPTINNPSFCGVTAGVNTRNSGCYIDAPGAVGGQQYSLALQLQAATGTSALFDVCMIAIVL